MTEPTYKLAQSPQEVATVIAETINQYLGDGKKVLWFVSGGSSITVSVLVAQQIKSENAINLTVTLTDERYGPVGHPDSNWQQLIDAGFAIPGATFIPVLSGKDRADTALDFAKVIEQVLAAADFTYGLFGIGADGHTAGILPGSEAVKSNKLTCDYKWKDYERITITGSIIAKIDEAVVFAMGKTKWPTLKDLRKSKDINIQPVQMLKEVPKLTIFTDYKEGES